MAAALKTPGDWKLKRKDKGIRELATIGYESVSLAAFLETLQAADVTLLLDVRELAMSRRKGFSKTALSQALYAAGIGYQHERSLGAPKTIRHRLRKDRDLKRYFSEFRKYLATQRSLLDHLAGSLEGSVALMCFERDPAECHRSVVIAELAERLDMDFRHLTVSTDDAKQTQAHSSSRQGISAAK